MDNMKLLRRQNITAPGVVNDDVLKYMVIAARHKGQWVLVRLKGQETWGFPGGHREEGETMDQAARRELYEETGAREFTIRLIAEYGVENEGRLTWGSIYLGDIYSFDPLPEDFEIQEVAFFDEFPLDNCRFPGIMPEMMRFLKENNFHSRPDEG